MLKQMMIDLKYLPRRLFANPSNMANCVETSYGVKR